MKCPFNHPEELAAMIDDLPIMSKATEIMDAFKKTTDETQLVAYNTIEDMMFGMVAQIQHNTIRAYYCPTKKCYGCCDKL